MSNKIILAISVLAIALWGGVAAAAQMEMKHEGMEHGKMHEGMLHHGGQDNRTPLNNPPMIREHQLSMMREHLKAVTDITALMAGNEFEKASKIAHEKLGLTPEMKKSCDLMGNETYSAMGVAFHQAGDRLGDALMKKDLKTSVKALNETLSQCVNCHNTFKQ